MSVIRSALVFGAILLAHTFASFSAYADETADPETYNPMTGRATTWDLNLELGFLRGLNTPYQDERVSSFLGRAQTGVMFVKGTHFYGAGPFVDHAFSFGREGSNTSLGLMGYYSDAQAGPWSEIGIFRSSSPSLGYLFGVGMGPFGVEFETRKRFADEATRDWFALFKVRIPVSAILFLIKY